MVLPHLSLRLGGHFYTDSESWSVGLKFRSVTGGDPGALEGMQAKLESWRDAIKALNGGNVVPTTMLSFLNDSTTIEFIRASSVGADGKEDAVALVEIGQAVRGTGSFGLPAQLAVACSLRTGRPGGSYRGRMYWPAVGQPPSGGEIPPARCSALATDVAGWISAVENAGASIITPGVRCNVVSTTKAVATPVTSVAVGSRFDIQRRRSEGQQESYSVASVAE